MGTSNLAARRGAKANRRKAIVEQKRKADAAALSPAGRAETAALLPIQYCLMSANLFEAGMGILVLARGSSIGPVVIGGFLIDTFCRGVKDTFIRTIDGEQLDDFIESLEVAGPLADVDPSYARKLLRDLVQWSGSLGFPPARTFAGMERLFGDVNPQACNIAFAFGQDGKPLYISGSAEPESVARRNIEQMSQRLGSDGFHYVVAIQPPQPGGM